MATEQLVKTPDLMPPSTVTTVTVAAAAATVNDTASTTTMPPTTTITTTSSLTTNINTIKSDSDLLQMTQQFTNATKNKSNLFLIKSYSFIDKNNQKRQHNGNQNNNKNNNNNNSSNLQRKSLQLNNFVNNIDKLLATEEQQQINNEKSKKNSSTKKQKKSKKLLKPLEKSKSLQEPHNAASICNEDLSEYMHLLRQPVTTPAMALECNASRACDASGTRPMSLPANGVNFNETSVNIVDQHPSSLPNGRAAIKRESFLRQSLQSLRRSFSSSKKYTPPPPASNRSHVDNDISPTTSSASSSSSAGSPKGSAGRDPMQFGTLSEEEVMVAGSSKLKSGAVVIVLNDDTAPCDLTCDGGGGKSQTVNARSTSSVSTLSYTAADINSMAPLHTHPEAQSDTSLNTLSKQQNLNSNLSSVHTQQQQQNKFQKGQQYCHQLSLPETAECDYSTTSSGTTTTNSLNSTRNDTKSLRQSSNSLNPLVTVPSTSSIRSGSSNSSSTAKHEQNAMVASNAQAATGSSTEKEKKRKEVSSSRVKKFHRHFTQVPKDEKLINYFSCALVSDILLQGHLYITEQHFAFYSNVFGYVTKVVIPTSSVTKISKEKTAKIIPNAVGVATADERHVFGSFISRESAFRLMCSVCPPMAPAEILPKAQIDMEICEEYSIEDDSSCSISGNESPPQLLANGKVPDNIDQSLLRRPFGSSMNIAEAKIRASDIPLNANIKTPSNLSDLSPMRHSMPPNIFAAEGQLTEEAVALRQRLTPDAPTNSSSTSGTPSHTSSSPITVVSNTTKSKILQRVVDSVRALIKNTPTRIRIPSLPSELHLIYLGVWLAVLLSLFSVFLLYRVQDIEAKANLYNFNYRSGNDDDIFNEALRWQKELQAKSTEEAQNILTQNLQQIAKVRRSLETLSMLIHDRSSALDTTATPSVDYPATVKN